MKKRYRILAGLLALSTVFVIAGCGKKEEKQEEQQTQVQVTVAPVTAAPAEDENLVSMQQNTDETSQISKVMGTKSSTAASLVVINQTGSEISQIYIRPNTDDEDWGEDLVKGSFKLGNGEKAVYYYEKGETDDSGNPVTQYDIRIVYTDTDRSECYFRKLPMTAMTEITLRMDGTGEDSIPYATYKSSSGSGESSTLNEVKQRLGLLDDGDDEEENDDSEDTSSDTDSDSSSDSGYEEPVVEPDANASQAAGYIGQPLENLTGAMGSATDGEDYVDEPVTGKTGYHYYDTFTVSTTVDDNGNEVVTGVW